jgi:hypothetical protein
MHTLALISSDFWLGFGLVFFFVFIFVLISFGEAQATGGWGSFVKRYPAKTRPAGEAYRVLSWQICNVYDPGRCLRVIFTDTGIYFYMTFFRRLAHPPFLLPWESVKRIKKGHGFLGEHYILEVNDMAGAFNLDLPKAVEHHLSRHCKEPITFAPEPRPRSS